MIIFYMHTIKSLYCIVTVNLPHQSYSMCVLILIYFKKKNSKTKLFFLFSVHIQACRALTIIALILGLVGIILSTMGLKCIKIGSKTDESKGKTMVIGGIIFIFAGKQKYSMCPYEHYLFLLLFNCLHVSPFYLASI